MERFSNRWHRVVVNQPLNAPVNFQALTDEGYPHAIEAAHNSHTSRTTKSYDTRNTHADAQDTTASPNARVAKLRCQADPNIIHAATVSTPLLRH